MNDFTEDEQDIIDHQAWTDESLVTILARFDPTYGSRLDHFRRQAVMENGGFDFTVEYDGKYARVQVDGSDIVTIEPRDDGTAQVTVYARASDHGEVIWGGSVDLFTV